MPLAASALPILSTGPESVVLPDFLARPCQLTKNSHYSVHGCNESALQCVERGEASLAGDRSAEQAWSELMRAALLGDAIAYQRVLVAIAPHVRSVARGVVGHRGFGTAEVEDVVQETLLAVHLKRATWDPEKPFLPWLNAVARHKAVDALRRKGGRVEMVIDDFHDLIATPEVDGDRQIDVDIALAGLDQHGEGLSDQRIDPVEMRGE